MLAAHNFLQVHKHQANNEMVKLVWCVYIQITQNGSLARSANNSQPHLEEESNKGRQWSHR